MAFYTIEIMDDGVINAGQPAGALVSGISIPDNCTYQMEFTVIARNTNNESWGSFYRCMWERDAGAGVPLQVGPFHAIEWTCPGSLDWGYVVEVDVNNELQIRAFGTTGAYDVRWAVTGFMRPCFPPGYTP
jgi:hypothetical protein